MTSSECEWPSEHDQMQYKKVYDFTIQWLHRHELPYKTVLGWDAVVFDKDTDGGAVWTSIDECHGELRILRGCDYDAVVHELGHGMNEKLRKVHRGKGDFASILEGLGHDYAEALRQYVRDDLDSELCAKDWNVADEHGRIVDQCDNREQFVIHIRTVFRVDKDRKAAEEEIGRINRNRSSSSASASSSASTGSDSK